MATKPVAGAGLPSAEDLDKVADEQKAKEATGPAPEPANPTALHGTMVLSIVPEDSSHARK